MFEQFHQMMTGNADALAHPERLGKLAVFEGVRNYPARVKCASLAWHTLRPAGDAEDEDASTEAEKRNRRPWRTISSSSPTNTRRAPKRRREWLRMRARQ